MGLCCLNIEWQLRSSAFANHQEIHSGVVCLLSPRSNLAESKTYPRTRCGGWGKVTDFYSPFPSTRIGVADAIDKHIFRKGQSTRIEARFGSITHGDENGDRQIRIVRCPNNSFDFIFDKTVHKTGCQPQTFGRQHQMRRRDRRIFDSVLAIFIPQSRLKLRNDGFKIFDGFCRPRSIFAGGVVNGGLV